MGKVGKVGTAKDARQPRHYACLPLSFPSSLPPSLPWGSVPAWSPQEFLQHQRWISRCVLGVLALQIDSGEENWQEITACFSPPVLCTWMKWSQTVFQGSSKRPTYTVTKFIVHIFPDLYYSAKSVLKLRHHQNLLEVKECRRTNLFVGYISYISELRSPNSNILSACYESSVLPLVSCLSPGFPLTGRSCKLNPEKAQVLLEYTCPYSVDNCQFVSHTSSLQPHSNIF